VRGLVPVMVGMMSSRGSVDASALLNSNSNQELNLTLSSSSAFERSRIPNPLTLKISILPSTLPAYLACMFTATALGDIAGRIQCVDKRVLDRCLGGM
jgi:hypothetical protein